MFLRKISNRSYKGSVMAEAALVIPLLLGITFVIIEFGNVLYLENTLNQIARSAARSASVTPSYTQEELIDTSMASSLLPDVSKLTLTVVPAPGTARSIGASITVTALYSYTPLVNPFGFFNSNTSWIPQIKGVSTVRSEVSS